MGDEGGHESERAADAATVVGLETPERVSRRPPALLGLDVAVMAIGASRRKAAAWRKTRADVETRGLAVLEQPQAGRGREKGPAADRQGRK
jgi:hypothetical protein